MKREEAEPRRPLNRDRVLRAAIDLADREGLDALTMRRLGAELDVEAMALYKHVANKDEILDGMIELVIDSIDLPDPDASWKDAMRRRARSARKVFVRHSWAMALLESRGTTGAGNLRYQNAVLGSLRSAGFGLDDAAHAFWILDSFVYGQVIQEISIPADAGETSELMTEMAASLPHLMEMGAHAADHDFTFEGEFEFGLDLLLDALDARLR